MQQSRGKVKQLKKIRSNNRQIKKGKGARHDKEGQGNNGKVRHTTASNICKLQAVQNFAARIITNSRKFDYVTPLRCELHWLPVKLHLFYRDYLSEKFVHRGSISGRCTRNSQSLNIPLYKSATGQRTFYYRAVSLWNDLPANIKTSTSLKFLKLIFEDTSLKHQFYNTIVIYLAYLYIFIYSLVFIVFGSEKPLRGELN